MAPGKKKETAPRVVGELFAPLYDVPPGHRGKKLFLLRKRIEKKKNGQKKSSTAVLYIHTSLCDFNASPDFQLISKAC